MMNNKKITIVLPAYNAALTLNKTFNEIPHDIIDDVILTDDASKDNTVQIAQELNIHTIIHPQNKGYGANQKTCYKAALDRGADIVIMLHPDYQYSPKLLHAMVSMLTSGHYDGVIASRILGKGALAGGMPLYKYIANRGLTFIQNILLNYKLSEYHTGYRGWTKEVLESLPLDTCSDDFIFDNQMMAQAIYQNFRIGEISCPTKYFKEASSINLKRSIIYGLGVLKTSIEYRLNKLGLISNKLFKK